MSDHERHLPPGWAGAKIGEVVERKVAQGVPAAEDNIKYIDIGSIDNQTKRIDSPKNIRGSEAPSRARQYVRSNDILVSMTRPNLNAVAKVPESLDGAICSTGFDVLRATGVEPDWLFFTVRSESFVDSMSELVQGALYPAVRSGDVRGFELRLPPLAEQHRILSKIKALQERTRRAREALAEVASLLEQFRQSVLAAAFRGDLTADWRTAHLDVVPASELLARIRAERRQRWEEAHLAKCEAAGMMVRKNWRDKYKQPQPVDESGLPRLPSGWCWSSAAEVVEPGVDIVYGIVQPGPPLAEGIPYVRGLDIQDGVILVEQLWRTSPQIAQACKRSELRSGDVLLAIIRHLKVAIVPPALNGGNMGRATARFRPSFAIETEYVAGWLASPFAQHWLRGQSRGGTDMPIVNIADVRRLPVPLAPLQEQTIIATLLTELSTSFTSIRNAIRDTQHQLDTLDGFILAKAFRGELVLQNPNDEPASGLLDRIRAERAKLREAGRMSKPSRSSKMPRSSRLPTNVRRPLREVLAERTKPMSPEELLTAAGYDAESIEDFYLALREAVRTGIVREHHPDRGPILLEDTRP